MEVYQMPDALLARCAGDESICRRVLDKYSQQMQVDVSALVSFVESGNCQEACRVAHRIKGASANVAAMEISRLASDIEKLAADGQQNEATPLTHELVDAWNQHRERLASLLQSN